jgi:hypothetical protein
MDAERDWNAPESQPCARCLELEAEVERLRYERARSIEFGQRLSGMIVELQMELLRRRTRQKKQTVGKRQERRRRARLKAKAREVGIGGMTLDDALLELARSRNIEQGGCGH